MAILVVLAEGGGGMEPITSKGPGALFFERLFIAQQFKRTRSSGTYDKFFFKSGLYIKGLISVKTYKCSK